ncbi:hypothetical protein ACILE2_00885 [Capnocytophaga canimorsus]|uniref:hypothetical protein n=1 Tax=Capnocytophaga canimorsus TaxID=28188 RepID=UPI0037D1C7EC
MTTNFESWLDNFVDDHHDVYCIYRSVYDIDEYGPCKTQEKTTKKGNKQYFVSYSNGEILLLATEKAYKCFLKHLSNKYSKGDNIEDWYDFKCAVEKDD